MIFFITHGASEASGVPNFWHLSAKILYTVEPKTATSPCIHFEVAASPTEKKTSLLHVCVLSHFEIAEIIGPNTQEMTWSAFFFFDDLLHLKTTLWITTFQALLKGIFSWLCFLPFAGKHRSRTVLNPFYIYIMLLFYILILCILYYVSYIMYLILCILYYVSYIMYLILCICLLYTSDAADE